MFTNLQAKTLYHIFRTRDGVCDEVWRTCFAVLSRRNSCLVVGVGICLIHPVIQRRAETNSRLDLKAHTTCNALKTDFDCVIFKMFALFFSSGGTPIWVWVIVAVGVLGVVGAVAAGALFMKGGAPPPDVPDIPGLAFDPFVDEQADVFEAQMQIAEPEAEEGVDL